MKQTNLQKKMCNGKRRVIRNYGVQWEKQIAIEMDYGCVLISLQNG